MFMCENNDNFGKSLDQDELFKYQCNENTNFTVKITDKNRFTILHLIDEVNRYFLCRDDYRQTKNFFTYYEMLKREMKIRELLKIL
jgi:hypothetical protein